MIFLRVLRITKLCLVQLLLAFCFGNGICCIFIHLLQVLAEVQKQMNSFDAELKDTNKGSKDIQQAQDLEDGLDSCFGTSG